VTPSAHTRLGGWDGITAQDQGRSIACRAAPSARRERAGRVAARLYAIANALDGMSRAEAARLAGMERQALRDAVLRYNGEDLARLRDRAKGRPQRRLTEGEEAALAAVILRGPDPERDGCCAWTRGDLCRWMAAHFGKTYHPSSMTRVLRRMGSRAGRYAPPTRPRSSSKKGGYAQP
jgi:transposase